MNYLKKIILFSILPAAVILSLMLAGCIIEETPESSLSADNSETSEPININIGSLKGPTSIGMLKLNQENPSLGKTITANYEIIPSPDVMISGILAGEIDIATLPTNVAVNLYNKGADYRLGGIVGYGVLYIVYQNYEINSWEDLKGSKIYITSKGSTPDVILRYLLTENGIGPDNDIELDYSVEQVELSQLLISGKADLAILPEPFTTMVLNNGSNIKIAFDVEAEWQKIRNGSPLPMSCVVISTKLINNYPDIVNTFLTKYEESTNWVNENPQEASVLVEKYEIGMDAATAMEAIPRCHIKFTPAQKAKDSVNNYIEAIYEFSPEDVGGKMPDEEFYY